MKKFITQHKTGLALFILFVVVIPLTYFVGQYYFEKIDERQEKMQEISIDEEIVDWQLNNLDKYKDQEQLIGESEQYLDVFVPDSSEAKVALADRFYEEIAPQTDMFVEVTPVNEAVKRKASNPAPAVEKKPSTADEEKDATAPPATPEKKVDPFAPINDHYIQLNITAEGSYENYIHLLNKIENMQYLADITKLSVVKKHSKGGSQLLRTNEEGSEEAPEEKKDQVTAIISAVFYLEDITKE